MADGTSAASRLARSEEQKAEPQDGGQLHRFCSSALKVENRENVDDKFACRFRTRGSLLESAHGERLYVFDGSLKSFATQLPSAVGFSSSESDNAPGALQSGWRDPIRLRVVLP